MRTIGEGTFGKVKLAVHNLTKEKVAIKILKKKCFCESSDIDRVTREIYILKVIQHPYLIHLYEIINLEDKIFVIMEFVPGGELFEYIESVGRLEEVEACRIFQQVVSAIEYLHSQNIAHRDLKPENILLDFKKDVKIIDFGLSNLFKDGEKLRTSCGSPCYAPPEMILNKNYDPIKADIWSAGIILYQMVCGVLPFEDENTTKLYNKIVSGKFAFPAFLSGSCQSLILFLLATDPLNRYSISEIKSSQFYSKYSQNLPKGIIKGYNEIPIVKEIERILKIYNIDIATTFDSVKKGVQDRNTTIYYIILHKYLMTGENPIESYDNCIETAKKLTSFDCVVKRRPILKVKNKKKVLLENMNGKFKQHKSIMYDHLPSVTRFSMDKKQVKVEKKSGQKPVRGRLGESLNLDQENKAGYTRKNIVERARRKAVSLDEDISYIFKTR